MKPFRANVSHRQASAWVAPDKETPCWPCLGFPAGHAGNDVWIEASKRRPMMAVSLCRQSPMSLMQCQNAADASAEALVPSHADRDCTNSLAAPPAAAGLPRVMEGSYALKSSSSVTVTPPKMSFSTRWRPGIHRIVLIDGHAAQQPLDRLHRQLAALLCAVAEAMRQEIWWVLVPKSLPSTPSTLISAMVRGRSEGLDSFSLRIDTSSIMKSHWPPFRAGKPSRPAVLPGMTPGTGSLKLRALLVRFP